MSIEYEYERPNLDTKIHEATHFLENRHKVETMKHERDYLKNINEKLLRAIEIISREME